MTTTLQYRKMQTNKTKVCSRCGKREGENALECSACGYAFRIRFIPPIDERLIVSPPARRETRDFFAERSWTAILDFCVKTPAQKLRALLSPLTPALRIAVYFALASLLSLLAAPVLIWLLDRIPG